MATLPDGKLPVALLRDLIASRTALPPEVVVGPGIGEDACVIDLPAGSLVATTDPITLTGKEVGAHAVQINANDVAVTGARPRYFLACVLLPRGTDEATVRALFAHMRAALDAVGAVLVGGHTEVTAAVSQPVVVGQMLGHCESGAHLRTGGVRPGDAILQIGPAPVEGAAVLAAELPDRLGAVPAAVLERAASAIAAPGISVVEPALRAAALGARALHDPTEGGLSAGLHELAEASGVALEVDADAVLWFEPGRVVANALGLDPWGILASGTLLAALPAERAGEARAALEAEGYAVARIATAAAGHGVRSGDGPLPRFERDELSRVLQPARRARR